MSSWSSIKSNLTQRLFYGLLNDVTCRCVPFLDVFGMVEDILVVVGGGLLRRGCLIFRPKGYSDAFEVAFWRNYF